MCPWCGAVPAASPIWTMPPAAIGLTTSRVPSKVIDASPALPGPAPAPVPNSRLIESSNLSETLSSNLKSSALASHEMYAFEELPYSHRSNAFASAPIFRMLLLAAGRMSRSVPSHLISTSPRSPSSSLVPLPNHNDTLSLSLASFDARIEMRSRTAMVPSPFQVDQAPGRLSAPAPHTCQPAYGSVMLKRTSLDSIPLAAPVGLYRP